MAALGKSWEITKGKEFPIVISMVLVMVVFYGIAYAPALLFGAKAGPVLAVVSRLASTAGTAIVTAMGVAIYGIISTRDASGTFS